MACMIIGEVAMTATTSLQTFMTAVWIAVAVFGLLFLLCGLWYVIVTTFAKTKTAFARISQCSEHYEQVAHQLSILEDTLRKMEVRRIDLNTAIEVKEARVRKLDGIIDKKQEQRHK